MNPVDYWGLRTVAKYAAGPFSVIWDGYRESFYLHEGLFTRSDFCSFWPLFWLPEPWPAEVGQWWKAGTKRRQALIEQYRRGV